LEVKVSSILAGDGTVDLIVRWSLVLAPALVFGLLRWHARPPGRARARR